MSSCLTASISSRKSPKAKYVSPDRLYVWYLLACICYYRTPGTAVSVLIGYSIGLKAASPGPGFGTLGL